MTRSWRRPLRGPRALMAARQLNLVGYANRVMCAKLLEEPNSV
jgi:hypothetical protein